MCWMCLQYQVVLRIISEASVIFAINFFFIETAFSQSLSSLEEIEGLDDVFVFIDVFVDELQAESVSELSAFHRDYIVLEELSDSELKFFNHNEDSLSSLTDYAQVTAVVSAPIFLRFLPALAHFAKNNMIIAIAAALAGGVIVFTNTNYFSSTFSNTSMIKESDAEFSQLPSKLLSKLLNNHKSSKRFDFFSQKGPEYEKNLILPVFEEQEQKLIIEHRVKEQKFNKFRESINPHNYRKELLKEPGGFKDDSLEHRLQYVYDHFAKHFHNLKEDFQANSDVIKAMECIHKVNYFVKTSKIIHSILASSSLWFLNQAKLAAFRLECRNMLSRNSSYQRLTTSNAKKIWDTLLFEYIAHVELLQEYKDPLFEEEIYLPFIRNQLSIASLSSKNFDYDMLLQNTFIKLETLQSDEEIQEYLDARAMLLMWIDLAVSTRVGVWNRKYQYSFLPGYPRSDQAFKDWYELFRLAHPLDPNPLDFEKTNK